MCFMCFEKRRVLTYAAPVILINFIRFLAPVKCLRKFQAALLLEFPFALCRVSVNPYLRSTRLANAG